jgi:Plant ATP synthase F0.
MPQLDIGIFFLEVFFNFLCFWFFYFFLLKTIFPKLNFSLKLRKSKIKQLNLNFVKFKKKMKILSSFKLIQDSSFISYIFSIKGIKKNILSLLVFKDFYFSFFFNKNKSFIDSSLKNKLGINFLLS